MHKLLEKHVCTAHSARKPLDEDRAGPNEGTSSSTTTRTTHQDFCDLNVCRPSKSEKRKRVDWTGDNKKKEKPKCPPPKATTSKRSRTDDSKWIIFLVFGVFSFLNPMYSFYAFFKICSKFLWKIFALIRSCWFRLLNVRGKKWNGILPCVCTVRLVLFSSAAIAQQIIYAGYEKITKAFYFIFLA